jgi:hypothetical protein
MITPDEIAEPSHAQTIETILLQRYPKLVLSIDKFSSISRTRNSSTS